MRFANNTYNGKLKFVGQFDGVKSEHVPLSILYHRLTTAKNTDEEIKIRSKIIDLLKV